MEPSFSGYVSKANLLCADGRTIMPGAFKHQDGNKVPLVYQHNHSDVVQVLGHVMLSDRDGDLWGDAYLNETNSAKHAQQLIDHGDIDKFSIWAKNLIERGDAVHQGDVQEVSLVLAGANPGATIANVLSHDDFDEELAIVGFEIRHSDDTDTKDDTEEDSDTSEEDKTVGDVLDTLTPEQETAVNAVIDNIIRNAVEEAKNDSGSDDTEDDKSIEHNDLEDGKKMTRNVFTQTPDKTAELKHSDVEKLFSVAKSSKTDSLRDLIRSSTGQELMHAGTYGVDNIEVLFPDAAALSKTPQFVDRRQEWVRTFMGAANKSPFSRIKTLYADITADEARAKGYIKGDEKTEEVFPVFKRSTGPTMVYKKQKLDRQDIIDITDFDVVAWLKLEMRGKLDEELARAAIFGDGRTVGDEDKIAAPTGPSGDGIRPIISDDNLYTTKVTGLTAVTNMETANEFIDDVSGSFEDYQGSGSLSAYMPYALVSKLLRVRDDFGHRIYKSDAELASDMGLNNIVRVPTSIMNAANPKLMAVIFDPSDYNFGANAGGNITLFDDFDIDFNQYKYLMETYLSGALTRVHSAYTFASA